MADTLDIRDLIERFEELESERENLQAVLQDALEIDQTGPEQIAAHRALSQWDCENGDEFTELSVLLTELSGRGGDEQWRGDWYPVTLVSEGYFEEYMDALLEECGDIPKFENVPAYIDITVNYDMLRWDYDEVEFQGETYLFR